MPDPPDALKQITADKVKQVTQKAKDDVGVQDLVMPVDVYSIGSVREPGEPGPRPCLVWSRREVDAIMKIASDITTRLFRIRLAVSGPLEFSVPTMNDLFFRDDLKFAEQQSRFRELIGHSGNAPSFDERRTHILFLGRVYAQKEGVPDHKARLDGSAKGLILEWKSKPLEYPYGGNRILVGYLKSRTKEMAPADRDKTCSLTGGFLPAIETLGATVAHELGHSLNLRHIHEDSRGQGAKADALARNVMHRDLDLKVEDALPSGGYEVLPFQVADAQRFGRCTGRFRNVDPAPADRCETLFRDLGL